MSYNTFTSYSKICYFMSYDTGSDSHNALAAVVGIHVSECAHLCHV